MISRVFVENFRCFSQVHRVRLAPVTLLVGENSTGKSSFLAAIRAAWDIARGKTLIDFNEDPFQLGAFQTIANYRGGRAGRADCFAIGLDAAGPTAPAEPVTDLSVGASFAGGGPQPVATEWWVRWRNYEIRVAKPPAPRDRAGRLTATTPSAQFRMNLRYPGLDPLLSLSDLSYVAHFAHQERTARPALDLAFEGELPPQAELTALEGLASLVRSQRRASLGRSRPLAIAPVRTRPKRTYDPTSDTPTPEGEHIPLVLARVFSAEPNRWESLSNAIASFGEASGLFSDLHVKRLGTHENSPFQLTVKVGGPAVNLVDVGYGVSQVLPVLVDTLNLPRDSTMLLQQPEVHLHPKAQAALGTFLWNIAAAQQKQLIVETHSDYLLDRIRLDLRNKKGIKASDVLILFFERSRSSVHIHELGLDDEGNILDAPLTYRRFFLEEERRFWG